MEYKNKWISGQKNFHFWEEVLVGRKIESLEWIIQCNGMERIGSVILDSGERVSIDTNGIMSIGKKTPEVIF
jgi:hypothetical protein